MHHSRRQSLVILLAGLATLLAHGVASAGQVVVRRPAGVGVVDRISVVESSALLFERRVRVAQRTRLIRPAHRLGPYRPFLYTQRFRTPFPTSRYTLVQLPPTSPRYAAIASLDAADRAYLAWQKSVAAGSRATSATTGTDADQDADAPPTTYAIAAPSADASGQSSLASSLDTTAADSAAARLAERRRLLVASGIRTRPASADE